MLKLALFFFMVSSFPPKPVYNTGWDRLDRFMTRQHRKYDRKEAKRIRKQEKKHER
tara:strand:+ start:450 stop:617 length:168 start_codon:yes stop_codon:yes gene_type:complete